MSVRPLLITGGAAVAVMLAASLLAWGAIPDDARIPIHWNLAGEVDGYAPKAIGLLATPALAVALTGVLAAIPAIDPRRENLARSGPAYVTITSAAILLVAGIHLAIVWAALGNTLDIARVVGIGVGVLFVVIGNFLGKTRSNWFMGIRTPWTLSSELSWTKTHRLAGRLFALVGVLAILVAVVGVPELMLAIVLGGSLVLVAVVVAYSYLVWRDDPERAGGAESAD